MLRKDGQWYRTTLDGEGGVVVSVLACQPKSEGDFVGPDSGDGPGRVFKMSDLLDFVEGVLPDDFISDLRKACKDELEERLVFSVGAKDWDTDTHDFDGCVDRMVATYFVSSTNAIGEARANSATPPKPPTQ